MRVEVLKEAGYEEARLGLSLSYNIEDMGRMDTVMKNLAGRDGGHNKFLESIQVWLDINAPRYWWQEFDTYRVGTTKQSESTMHTLLRRPLIQDDFEGGIDYEILEILNESLEEGHFMEVKRNLPESFLQRRIVSTNYKTLRNMILQRRDHRLKEWRWFCKILHIELAYSYLLPNPYTKENS